MPTLTDDAPRTYGEPTHAAYPMAANDVIYQGAAVGENGSGYARPLVAADRFLGFAENRCDNTGGAVGAKSVRLRTKGVIKLSIAALAVTANDRPIVYASDDDTFTLTATSNSAIGRVLQWESLGVALVEFDAALAAGL